MMAFMRHRGNLLVHRRPKKSLPQEKPAIARPIRLQPEKSVDRAKISILDLRTIVWARRRHG